MDESAGPFSETLSGEDQQDFIRVLSTCESSDSEMRDLVIRPLSPAPTGILFTQHEQMQHHHTC